MVLIFVGMIQQQGNGRPAVGAIARQLARAAGEQGRHDRVDVVLDHPDIGTFRCPGATHRIRIQLPADGYVKTLGAYRRLHRLHHIRDAVHLPAVILVMDVRDVGIMVFHAGAFLLQESDHIQRRRFARVLNVFFITHA